MRKSIAIILIAIMSMTMFVACGSKLSIPDDYKYDDLSKYITLGKYKGIEYEKEKVTITRHQIEAKIDELREQYKEEKKLTEGTVTEDCVANIDYVGSIDGKEFEGGSAQGYDLDIANSTFIAGFAEALVGHKVGENFDINVTFPDNYGSADLAGKPAVFNITVNYITVSKLPEYNEKFVKECTDFKSTDELEASLEKDLRTQEEQANEAKARYDVLEKILKSSKVIEYPEKEYNTQLEKLTKKYKDQAAAAGVKIGDYVQQQLGLSEEAFNKQVADTAEENVKFELVLHQIARLENIEYTEQGYHDFIYNLLDKEGMTADEFKEQNGSSIEEFAEQNDMFTSYLYQIVMDKVMEYSKAK